MKKQIAVTLALALWTIGAWPQTSRAQGVEWSKCLEYWYTQNVGELPADPGVRMQLWTLSQDTAGVTISRWNVPGKTQPTMQALAALNTQAVAWWNAREAAKKADFDNWSDEQLKAAVQALLDEINTLRVQAGLAERTPAQLKEALKAKLSQ